MIQVKITSAIYAGYRAGHPTVSLHHDFIDLLITDQYGIQIFGFAVNAMFAHSFGAPFVGGSALFGGPSTFMFFHPANFSSTLESEPSVPEPTSWAMMLSDFGLVGTAMRTRRSNSLRLIATRNGPPVQIDRRPVFQA